MGMIIIGIVSITYFIGIACHTRLNSKFPFVWLILGSLCIALGIVGTKKITQWVMMQIAEDSSWIWCGIEAIIGLLSVTYAILFFGILLFPMKAKIPSKLAFVVVLGAQMKPHGPSMVLKKRLDSACDYLKRNKNTIVILSGGQGSNEPCTEAEGMERYLLEKGISQNRMRKESRSMNTHQNLLFSKELFLQENQPVGIVSSEFHLFRATRIAHKLGYSNVYGIPASSEKWMLLNHISREVCAVIKDFMIGNL